MAKSKKDKDKGEKKSKKEKKVKKDKKSKKMKKAATASKKPKKAKAKDSKSAAGKPKKAKPKTSAAAKPKPAAAKAKPKAAAAKPKAKASAPKAAARKTATTPKSAKVKSVTSKPKAAAAPAPKAKPAAKPKAPAPASKLPAIGSKAPDFSLLLDDGSTITRDALSGKKVVLYFYPKDDTPGCTIEAIAFTAKKAEFEEAGATIIGISKDSTDSHCKFKGKHSLSIALASDGDGKTLEAFGVWGEKSLYGRKFMGITRATFLLDDQGVIRKVWPKVSVQGHAEDVLEAMKTLS